AIEQAHAEFSLQCTDPTTELRSLHAQHLGSRGIAAAVDNLGKEVEVVQVLEGVHGEWPSKEAGTLIWHSQKASPDWGLNKGLLQHYPLRVRGLGSPQARSGEERTMLRVRAVDTAGPSCASRAASRERLTTAKGSLRAVADAMVASNLPVRTLVFSRVKEHKPRKQMQSNEAGSAEHILNGRRKPTASYTDTSMVVASSFKLKRCVARVAMAVAVLSSAVWPRAAIAEEQSIALPGLHAFPESLTSTVDGTLFIGRLGDGGIVRANPRSGDVAVFVPSGASETRSILGVLADERTNTLWVCSNDLSALGGPSSSGDGGSGLKGFDLRTGAAKRS